MPPVIDVALVSAVAAWRARRHAILADVVDAVAATSTPTPLVGRDKATYQRAWLELAKRTGDPAALGALAAGLTRSVPVREVRYLARDRDVKRYRPFLERIAALAECEPDPRIATAVCELLERAPFSVEDVAGVYGPAIDLLVQIGDERSIDRLRALVARPIAKTAAIRDHFARALPVAAVRIEKALRKRSRLSKADRTAAEQILGSRPRTAPKPDARNVDDLVAECLAHPGDDGPREVLADALLERDDPRGEFIQLQLRDARRELAEPDRKRIESLQRKHEKEWLGDLTRITKNRVFRRGFLDECVLLQGAAADAATWRRLAKDPILASIGTLHKGTASEELYRTFVFSPVMTHLREIIVPSTAMLRDLHRPIQHIVLTSGLTKEALAILDEVARRTGARGLTFETKLEPPALIDQLARWEPRRRFDELCAIFPYNVTGDEAWLLAFDRLGVRRLGLGQRKDNILVERVGKKYRVEIRASQESPVTWLLSLNLAIEKLVIRGTPAPWFAPREAFATAISKLPASAVELHEGWMKYAPKR
jgi:uncharacterized protein (TIGR02996 family)